MSARLRYPADEPAQRCKRKPLYRRHVRVRGRPALRGRYPTRCARIKLLILDSLGCALFGAGLLLSRILADTLQRVDTTQGCGVWGMPLRLSAPHAALVNGTLIQSFELDDVHRVGVLHVGAVTLPAVLRRRRDAACRTCAHDRPRFSSRVRGGL